MRAACRSHILGEHARLRSLPLALAQGLALRQLLGREPVEVALAGAAPPAVHGGDRPVPAVPYDVDDPGLWIHGADLPHELFVQERRLVPDELLAGLREPCGEEVLRGQTHQGVHVLVGISIPAPHRALDPQPQVLGVGQGVVEGAREALSFAGSRSARLQPAEKKRPSPLHSTSGWESRIFVSHLVPDLPSPVTKNTGVLSLRDRSAFAFLPASFRRHASPKSRHPCVRTSWRS